MADIESQPSGNSKLPPQTEEGELEEGEVPDAPIQHDLDEFGRKVKPALDVQLLRDFLDFKDKNSSSTSARPSFRSGAAARAQTESLQEDSAPSGADTFSKKKSLSILCCLTALT